MESPLEVGPSWKQGPGGPDRSPEQSFSTTLEIGGQFVVSHSDSVVALDTWATTALVCFRWPVNHNLFLQKLGLQKVLPYSAAARFKYGDGRVCEVKNAAGINVGVAGRRGAPRASAPDADIPALSHKGALETLGGRRDFERDISTIRKHGVRAPLRVNEMGYSVLCVVKFSNGPPCPEYRLEDCICHSWRAGFLVLFPLKSFRPVRQWPREMRRMIVSRTPRRLLRNCMLSGGMPQPAS